MQDSDAAAARLIAFAVPAVAGSGLNQPEGRLALRKALRPPASATVVGGV